MIPLRDANPSSTPQIVTIGLIILNALMWLYEVSLDPSWLLGPIPSDNFQLFVHNYGFIPARLRRGTRRHRVLRRARLDYLERPHRAPPLARPTGRSG